MSPRFQIKIWFQNRRTKWKKHNPGVSPAVHQQQRQLAKQQQKQYATKTSHTAKAPISVFNPSNLFLFNNDMISPAFICASLGFGNPPTTTPSD
jgi:hypothetical protein